jgi:hypothetical protein
MRCVRRPWLQQMVAVAAALACVVDAARAQSIAKEPASRLLERCELAQRVLETGGRGTLSEAQFAAAQTCVAFVDGFIWGHGWAAWRTQQDMYYCPPEEFSVVQAVPALVEYFRAHPERLDADSHILAFAALSYAFPCQPMPQNGSEAQTPERQAR